MTLELIDALYTAPTTEYGFFVNGPIPGAGPTSRVTIKSASNRNVTIAGSGRAVMSFLNTSYVTVDGVGLTGATTLLYHALYNSQFDWNDGLDFLNNSDHNVVQNITAVSEDVSRACAGIAFWNQNGSTASADSNVIRFNCVKKAGYAIFLSPWPIISRYKGNIIDGNSIGSETDSLISVGIYLTESEYSVVENNVVQNLKVSGIEPTNDRVTGIDSYWGNGDTIRNNVVHNLRSSTGYSCAGIILSGDLGREGSNNTVYNNMVFDIQSTSTATDNRVSGIQLWRQNNPRIYYNSVRLFGTGASPSGSAALYVAPVSTNVEAKNNIFVNTRDESPYCASALYDYSLSNLVSDHNDLQYQPNLYSCLARVNTGDYHSLSEWQTTGRDSHSVSVMPVFRAPYLHLDTTSTASRQLNARATTRGEVSTDFDAEPRHTSTPDIGADEMWLTIDGVEDNADGLPGRFWLAQNYPNPFNPSTSIRFDVPRSTMVKLKVYDLLGREVATLVTEVKQPGSYTVRWNAKDFAGGVYFYQLNAGSYERTKKLLLLR